MAGAGRRLRPQLECLPVASACVLSSTERGMWAPSREIESDEGKRWTQLRRRLRQFRRALFIRQSAAPDSRGGTAGPSSRWQSVCHHIRRECEMRREGSQCGHLWELQFATLGEQQIYGEEKTSQKRKQ